MEVWPTGRESHEDSARPGGAFSADFDYATTPGTRLPFAKRVVPAATIEELLLGNISLNTGSLRSTS